MKRYRKDALDLTRGSLGLSIGSDIITGAGGSAAPLASMSRFLPSMGKVAGGGVVIRTLGKLMPKKYRKKKY